MFLKKVKEKRVNILKLKSWNWMGEAPCRIYLVNLEKKLFKLYKVKTRIQVVYTRVNKRKKNL